MRGCGRPIAPVRWLRATTRGVSALKNRRRSLRSVAAASSCTTLLIVLAAVSPARAIAACVSAAPPPAPAASPAAAPDAGTVVSEGAAPSPTPFVETPLYSIGDQIYTEDRDGTLYYYFQSGTDGAGKIKYDMRYDRNLWDTCAQAQIRVPIITKIPGNRESLFGPRQHRAGILVQRGRRRPSTTRCRRESRCRPRITTSTATTRSSSSSTT